MSSIHFAFAIAAYYALHSMLAADGIKAKLVSLVPVHYYRLAYNVLAIVLLVALFILYFLVEKKQLWTFNKAMLFGGVIVSIAGLVWVFRAMSKYNMGEFTGMEQLRNGEKPVHTKLIVRGPNGKVRHPLYFGTLLITWGALLIFQNDAMFAFALITTIYIIIGSRLEEEKLVAQFGKAYQKYQREVPMLLPRWGKRLT